jgi:xanthine dehydrogenase YagT iron-sulfur-binding subunit
MSKKESGSMHPLNPGREPHGNVSRRGFLKGLGAGGIGSAIAPAAVLGAGTAATAGTLAGSTAQGQVFGPGRVPVQLRVNGQAVSLDVEPRETLLDVLRQDRRSDGDYVDVTGNKRVCDRASCGACSMLVDGKLTYGCTMLAIEAQGHEIVTVEGLGTPESMHAVQEAFVEADALMCGFCTPGMVVAVAALLQDNPDPTRAQIRKALDGNICRCGTYPRIFQAAETAAARLRGA